MSSTNQRLKIFPQLKFYDGKVNTRFIPFAILAGPQNLQSETVNTDSNGFRHSIFDKMIYTVENIKEYAEVSIFLGGSTTFGVGASCDAMTVVSQYANMSGGACLNLGVRGAVSIQELLHLFKTLPQANAVKRIIIFSGVNDLYVNFSQEIVSEFDARFEEVGSQHLAYTPLRYLVVKILAKLYGVNLSELLPLGKRELFLYLFSNRIEERLLSDCDRLEKIKQLQRRNFIIYSALQKQLNCKVIFALQPFFPWTKKRRLYMRLWYLVS